MLQNAALCGKGLSLYQTIPYFNSLPSHNFLDLTKLKVAKTMISVFDRVGNIMGKERKCWLPAFSPFPSMFLKGFFLMVVKSWDCVVKSIWTLARLALKTRWTLNFK